MTGVMSMPTPCAVPAAAFARVAWPHPADTDRNSNAKAAKAHGARRSRERST